MKDRKVKALKTVLLSIFFILTAYYIIVPFFEPSSVHLDIKLPLWVFYTIQTNIMVCIWYGYIILNHIAGKYRSIHQTAAAAVTVYILVTGIVYWTVLVPMLGAPPALFRFRNIWTHTITPLFTLWCFFNYSAKDEISLHRIPCILIYPLFYLVFSYLFVFTVYGKYPYPFLSPETMGGWVPVIISCILILLLFSGLSLGIRYLHNRRLLK